MPAKHNVLISYAKEDQVFAEKALRALAAHGIHCWAAFQNLEAGQFWPAAITDAIKECEIFLLILTRHSNASRQVVRELTEADNLNKRLYCFQTEDISISPNIQYFFSAVHRNEAFTVDAETSLTRMVDDIVRQLGEIDQTGEKPRPQEETPPPPPRRPKEQLTRTSKVLIATTAGLLAVGITATLLIGGRHTSVQLAQTPSPAPESHAETPGDPPVGAKNMANLPLTLSTPQPQTRTFNLSDFQLSINQENYFSSKELEIDGLDLARDFLISFAIKSTRRGGSTRYGIAWNFQPDDFLLFTIHSIGNGYYSIGAGRSRSRPFSRFSEGNIPINGERDFDLIQLDKRGADLIFLVNGQEVWRTTRYRLLSNRFAFWVADFSDAVMKSYTVQQ